MRSPLRSVVDLVVRPRNEGSPPIPYPSRAAQSRSVFSGTTTEATAAIDAMGSVGTLFNIVSTTAQAAAKVQWQLWRSSASGDPADRVLVADHQAKRVWDRPNDFMSGMRFRETQFQHLRLTGEGCWVMERRSPLPWPVGMWPVRPDRITPVPSVEKFLLGYVYTSPDGEQIPLNPDDVIRPLQPHPADPYRGMGAAQTILADLDSERYTAEWNRNFFRNSAAPGGILTVPDTLDDNDFYRIQRRWNEQHRGVAAAHRVAILEAGMTWVDRSFSQRDMQFAEVRQAGQDIIREAFGFPGFAAGKVTDVNRATAEASDIWFDKHLTIPDVDRVRDVLNTEFLPMFGPAGQGLEWDYISPLKDDDEVAAQVMVSKATAFGALVKGGAPLVEAARLAGLPDVDFGDDDPEHDLLTRLVTSAPALAPLILPVLMPGTDWSHATPEPVPAQLVAPEPAPGSAPVPEVPARPALEPAPTDRGVPLITDAPEMVPDGDDDSDADNTHLDGCMIALMPREQDAARLAVPGGEAAEDLHLTLRYLGPDAGMWPEQARAAMIDCAKDWFYGLPQVPARLFGAALWNPDGDKPAWVWNAGDDGAAYGLELGKACAIACAAAEDVAGAFLPDAHSPWVAHIAAVYGDDPAALPDLVARCGPVVFDRVRVSFGDADTDIPLDAPDSGGGVRGPGVERGDATYAAALPLLENAQRWVVKAHLDDNTCGPCRANDGKMYRNRESAYADYPDGTSYVNCVGEEFGNHCRCKVVKRGRKGGAE